MLFSTQTSSELAQRFPAICSSSGAMPRTGRFVKVMLLDWQMTHVPVKGKELHCLQAKGSVKEGISLGANLSPEEFRLALEELLPALRSVPRNDAVVRYSFVSKKFPGSLNVSRFNNVSFPSLQEADVACNGSAAANRRHLFLHWESPPPSSSAIATGAGGSSSFATVSPTTGATDVISTTNNTAAVATSTSAAPGTDADNVIATTTNTAAAAAAGPNGASPTFVFTAPAVDVPAAVVTIVEDNTTDEVQFDDTELWQQLGGALNEEAMADVAAEPRSTVIDLTAEETEAQDGLDGETLLELLA